MYFSKNSGYVLRKAKCFSPSSYIFGCLKENFRTLGVKAPIDDPSKPPLRLNVPKDSSEPYEGRRHDSLKFAKKDFQEPRSKSLLSKSNSNSIDADGETNVQKKSESETQLSKYSDDIVYYSNNLDYTPSYQNARQQNVENKDVVQVNYQKNSHSSNQFYTEKSDYDLNEGLVTLFDESFFYDTNKNLESGKYEASNNSNDTNDETKLNKIKQKDESHKNLYIIIDVPEKLEVEKFENENILFKNPNVIDKKKFATPQFSENNFSTEKANVVNLISTTSKESIKNNFSKTEQYFDSYGEKNKNLSKNLSKEEGWQNKDKSNVKFEVHEIDDASTYIFHLKLKRSLSGKPSTVERVPEKEINTRCHPYENENYDPVRIKRKKVFTKEVLDTNANDFTDEQKYSEALLKSQVQAKKYFNEALNKTKSNKSSKKPKLKRCLGDCPNQLKMSSKKSNEKLDANKNYKNQNKSEFHNYPDLIPEETKTEEISIKDSLNKTKTEVQNLEDVKMPFENIGIASEISPLKNPKSLAYQFFQEWDALSNFETISKESDKQPSQTTDRSKLLEFHENSETTFSLSDKFYTDFETIKPKSSSTESNFETFNQRNKTGDFAKIKPKGEEKKSTTSSTHDFEKYQAKKEYFASPLIKRQSVSYEKKTVVPSPEKKLREKIEYYTLSTSPSQAKNSALFKEEVKAEEKNKKKIHHNKLPKDLSHTEKSVCVSNREPMKLASQLTNQNKIKKKLKKLENEQKFDKNEKKVLHQSSVMHFSENTGENETMNRSKHRKKKEGNNRHVPYDRHNRDGRGESKEYGGSSKHIKVKMSSAEEDLNKCLKKERDAMNFQTSESVIKISSDRPAMKFCAAFPPLLNEVMSNRCRELRLIKQNSLFQQIWSKKNNFRLKDFETNRRSVKYVGDLSENSILFPKAVNQSFDFNNTLLECKKDGILNVLKNEKENDEKIANNMANIANESLLENKGKSSVDSLTMMKKVKEMVDLDLQNAVSIFEGRETEVLKDTSSVLTWNGDAWKVDLSELEKHVQNRKKRRGTEIKLSACSNKKLCTKCNNIKASNIILDYNENYKKIDDNQIQQRKYLPGVKESETEVKLNSVVEHYPTDDVFKVNERDLKYALRKSSDRFDKLYAQAVVLQIKKLIQGDICKDEINAMSRVIKQTEGTPAILKMKNGDSILVFDELTQTWTVDYSILEKRQEQKKHEEELVRKSELILETFEKIEKENMTTIDKPTSDSPSPKTFDYNKAEWKAYQTEKSNSSDKLKKAKQPFKESNAEEIRKKNSDLYENLFAVKKDETKSNQNIKEAPGLKSPANTKKESQSKSVILAKENDSKNSGDCKKDCNNIKEEKKDQNCENEEENYWETFIKTNILPFDKPEAPKKKPLAKETIHKEKEESNIKMEPKEKASCPPFSPTPPLKPDKKENEAKFRLPNIFKKNDLKKPNLENENKVSEAKISEPKTPSKTKHVSDVNTKNVLKDTKTDVRKNDSKEEPLNTSSNNSPSKNTSSKITAPFSSVDPLKTEISPPEKSTKNWSEHYVSENILEMSKTLTKEKNSKLKSNKVETVKLNISSDKKAPSIVTEINLNKKFEEQTKEFSVVPKKPSPEEMNQSLENTKKKNEKSSLENKRFYKNFEKYKTPFSDPDFEEKPMKINSDLESNPNLKKLDTWNKTLVLHDVAKPNENIETWLKDESDKMATLLLKVLQEAAEGKPKKKNPQGKTMPSDKNLNNNNSSSSGGGSNPYDNIRKKQETNSENIMFKMQSVNLSIENDKKLKNIEDRKSISLKFLPGTKNIPIQTSKSSKIVEVIKITPSKEPHHLIVEETAIEDVKSKEASETSLEKVNSFGSKEMSQTNFLNEWTEKIPGPEILKKMANTWKLFPIIGFNFGNSFLHSLGHDKSRRHIFSKLFGKYGPIVNLQGPLSGSVVLIYKPEHMTGVFQQDSLISVRSVFDSLDLSRRDADTKLLQTGIYTDWSKPEYNNLKKNTNDPLIKGCEKFLPLLETAGDSLVDKIKFNNNSQNFVSDDFMSEIKKWSMEGYLSVIFEKSFGILEGTNDQVKWLSEPEKLYLAIKEATNFLNKCERGFQIWRMMPTPSSVGLNHAYRSFSEILTKQLHHAEINLKNKNDLLKNNDPSFSTNLTFTESMLLNDGMPIEEIICNLVDMMVIGTNVMNSALGFMLYNLAQNQKVQNKLLKEVKEHLPEKSSRLDYHKLHSLKYLQACLKESLRLNMPFPLFFRLLQNDIILANYIIPKGTYVVMDSSVSCMKEQIFDNPEKFLPERWLNDERWMQANHPFSSIPFCHGPRAELAKRIAEIQLWSCLAKLVRNFEIEYQFGEIHGSQKLISLPDKPLKLNFIERLD